MPDLMTTGNPKDPSKKPPRLLGFASVALFAVYLVCKFAPFSIFLIPKGWMANSGSQTFLFLGVILGLSLVGSIIRMLMRPGPGAAFSLVLQLAVVGMVSFVLLANFSGFSNWAPIIVVVGTFGLLILFIVIRRQTRNKL